MSDKRYPIEKQHGFWVVWSLPIEHTISRNSEGLETFPSYADGMAECSRRNLAICEASGIADKPMPALGSRLSPYTYRDYYTRHTT